MKPEIPKHKNSTSHSMDRVGLVVVAVLGLAVLDGRIAFGQCQTEEGTCFQGIGDLAGGRVFSTADGVARAADGRVVVVGSSSSTASFDDDCGGCNEAVTFSAGALNGILTTANRCSGCAANDVTIVGSTVITVGRANGDAFRVVQDQLNVPVAPTPLPSGPGGIPFRFANGISDDGSVVVGNSDALRWTSAGETTVIPLLANAGFKPVNSALGASPHGTFTVGTSSSLSTTNSEAYIFPPPGIVIRQDPVALGDLDGGEFLSVANAVSNGGHVVGYSSSSTGDQAFRWKPAFLANPAQMNGLGDLTGAGIGRSEAFDISSDNSLIVGVASVIFIFPVLTIENRAFVWHSSFGMRNLEVLLIQDLGVTGLLGWKLTEATATSSDGLAIVGNGINPSGNNEGWLVTLQDCNGNGKWDFLEDFDNCNGNLFPDECETDCNENGIPDDCDIESGFSIDCDGNGVPEECDAVDTPADVFDQDQASAKFFRDARDNPTNPATFGTMIQRYGRPWSPGTRQTPGGVGICVGGTQAGMECFSRCSCPDGICEVPGGGPPDPDLAERLRELIGVRSRIPLELGLRVLEELHAFEMLLGNEAFADAMDPTVGVGASGEQIDLEQIPGMFAFRDLPAVGSLLDEELALLRGREISVPATLQDGFDDEPSTDPEGNYPQFGSAPRTPIYNRLRPNAVDSLGSLAYRSNYGFTNTTDNDAASQAFPQGHGDAYGYYLKATKVYLEAFGAGVVDSSDDAFALNLIQSQSLPADSIECETNDCTEIVDDDGEVHQVGSHGVRNMGVAMAARARAAIRIVDLTFRRDYREHGKTQVVDTNTERSWGVADWGIRAGTGAYLDWAVLNQLLVVPDDSGPVGIEAVDRTTVEQVGTLAACEWRSKSVARGGRKP